MADKIGTDEHGEILIYQTDDGQTNIEVKIEDDTVWLTQQQMSELFQTSWTNVVEHIKHIYEESELDEISTCRNFRQVRKEGNREVTRQFPHYNLDRIISLGYRIKSVIATRFRQWATQRLKEYMIKGFTIDDERLKGNGGKLLDRIRDIKSSESLGFFVIISDRRIWQRFFKKQCCWNASILHGHTKIEKMKLSNQELDNYSDGDRCLLFSWKYIV